MVVMRIKDFDLLTWEQCSMSDIRQGDIFYTVENGLKSSVVIAEENAKQVPHPRHKRKMIWQVKTKPY